MRNPGQPRLSLSSHFPLDSPRHVPAPRHAASHPTIDTGLDNQTCLTLCTLPGEGCTPLWWQEFYYI